MTFAEAENICRASGAHAASVHHDAENEFMASVAKQTFEVTKKNQKKILNFIFPLLAIGTFRACHQWSTISLGSYPWWHLDWLSATKGCAFQSNFDDSDNFLRENFLRKIFPDYEMPKIRNPEIRLISGLRFGR